MNPLTDLLLLERRVVLIADIARWYGIPLALIQIKDATPFMGGVGCD